MNLLMILLILLAVWVCAAICYFAWRLMPDVEPPPKQTRLPERRDESLVLDLHLVSVRIARPARGQGHSGVGERLQHPQGGQPVGGEQCQTPHRGGAEGEVHRQSQRDGQGEQAEDEADAPSSFKQVAFAGCL